MRNKLKKNKIMDYKNDHPEKQSDETYLGNFTDKDYKTIRHKTKRKGIKSYCIDGSDYLFQKKYDVTPVFVKTEEFNKILNK